MGQLGDLSPEGSIAIGILVGLLSTSIQSLGLTLQRKSHLLEDDKESYEIKRPPYKRRRWQLGMGMFILSNIVGSTIQITTLPLPVLSTLQASGLVFNTAFATLLLKEPFTRFSLIGTFLTCIGAAMIAVFGAIPEPAHTLNQLLELLGRKQFVLWMVGTLLIAVGTLVFSHFLKYWSSRVHELHSRSKRQQSPGIPRSRTRRVSMNISIPLPRAVQLRSSRLRLLRGLCYALISGILSAHSLLVAKSAVELIVRTVVDHINQFHSYQSWLILLALLFFALSQLYYLHLGLRLCSTSVLYPFVFCVYNIIAILDGLIYFRQTSRISVLHACLIALGTVILLSGVLALSWRLDDAQSTEAQPTPLGPGLGFVSSVAEDVGDHETSPLLSSARPRSSTSKQSSSTRVNESTPLLTHRPRKSTLLIYPPPPEAGSAQKIWAELDDSNESDSDVLASLPRSISPYLSTSALRSGRRRHPTGDSPSHSPAEARRSANDLLGPLGRHSNSSGSIPRRGRNDDLKRPPRRAQTLKERTAYEDRRRSSAPLSGSAVGSRASSTAKNDSKSPTPRSPIASHTTSSEANLGRTGAPSPGPRQPYRDRVRGRPRSATEAPRPVPSRWDVGGNMVRWLQGERSASGSGPGPGTRRTSGDSPDRPAIEDGRED